MLNLESESPSKLAIKSKLHKKLMKKMFSFEKENAVENVNNHELKRKLIIMKFFGKREGKEEEERKMRKKRKEKEGTLESTVKMSSIVCRRGKNRRNA